MSRSTENLEIDNTDYRILDELNQNAQRPYTEVAKKVFVSGGTVHVRMRKLQEQGIVKGSTLVLDYEKLGYDIISFLGIYLEKSSLYMEVLDQLKKIPEVVEMHYTTGKYNIFVKLLCKDTRHLKNVLHDKIQRIDGIERTETFMSLEESVNRHLSFGD
ncbi:MAG: Lrp/AsnC ligand binding domain-containing protein [Cyclobacteriaceae bacterium]|nr:Lrp/AsnC ligand binding domain-containing protein [Cyclobacteriaceae bacterium]MCH8517657.1 Lrp/AsnC ligand binding domain-containing protein [Cyclobacteriaceae bacterium]